MHPFNQRSSLVSEDSPQRTQNDILFDHEIYKHHQGTRYRWTEQQSRIFQDYVQEFPNDYAQNIDLLLARLNLHGYGGIETEQGNFEGRILIPKVLRKLINIVTRPRNTNHGNYQPTPHNQNSDSQVNHHYPLRPISNIRSENAELGHGYNNEHPGITVPQSLQPLDAQSPGRFGRLPSVIYGSQDLRRNNEFEIALRSLIERLHSLENFMGVKSEDLAGTWS